MRYLNRPGLQPDARGALAAALCLWLAACSGSADQARARHDAQLRKAAADATATEPTGPDTVDMVAAVGTGEAQRPVQLKFRLHDAPHVGEPLKLELALIQDEGLPIQSMHVSILPREGLQLKSEPNLEFVAPTTGATQMIDVELLPQQAGILGLAVTVLVNTEHESLSRSYAIPLIVVAAADAAGPAAAAGTGAASPPQAARSQPRRP